MKILLFVTKNYANLLPPFSYLFRKYFGNEEITVVSDKKLSMNLGEKFSYYVVPGYDRGQWDFKINFGDGLLKAMNHFEQSHYIVLFPDHWFYKKSVIKNLKTMWEYCQNNTDIVRANLTHGNCSQGYGQQITKYKNLTILKSDFSIDSCAFDSGITFCPSIFSTEHCNKILSTGWSLWQCENLGTEVMKNYSDGYTITSKEPIIYREHVCSQQRLRNVLIDKEKFNSMDIEQIQKRLIQWGINYL